jgi:hypothetical protein
MRFHLPSFLIGCAVGAGVVLAYPRVRPVVLEVASAAYRAYDALMARLGVAREDVEDFLAEAKARARAPRKPVKAPADA